MRGPALALLLSLFVSSAQAHETKSESASPCTAFDWSLMREQAWFSSPGFPRVASGATLSQDVPGARLELRPVAEAALPFAPSREPKAGTFAGVLRVPAPVTPGPYQVTVSDEAWIDVSQGVDASQGIDASRDGASLRTPIAHTGKAGCPGLRKSLRFQLGSAPLVIAVTGARAETIDIAVAPAE